MNKPSIGRRAQVAMALGENDSTRASIGGTNTAESTALGSCVMSTGFVSDIKRHPLGVCHARGLYDEECSPCYADEKSGPEDKHRTIPNGAVWVFAAINRDTMLGLSWATGLLGSECVHDSFGRVGWHDASVSPMAEGTGYSIRPIVESQAQHDQ